MVPQATRLLALDDDVALAALIKQVTHNSKKSRLMSFKNNKPGGKPARRLPDFAICQVKRSGIGNLIYCLVPEPNSCQHAEHVNLRTFCFHPDACEFGGRVV